MKARLHTLYKDVIVKNLITKFGFKNPHEVPCLKKIVINAGIKEATSDSKHVKHALEIISAIAGQKAVATKAKKSIAGFKLREGLQIGVKVTLRGKKMYDFFDKLIAVSLPCVRDFRGLNDKFDGAGAYNLGVKDWMIFPEVNFSAVEGIKGLNISVVTSTKEDKYAKGLLEEFGVPFIAH